MIVDVDEIKRHMKPKADSTLRNMKKDDLIAYIRTLEHNYNVAQSFLDQQARNFAEYAPVVPGHWVSDESDVLFHCSECETQISTSWDYDDLHWNYCPNCGAKMIK